MPSCGLSGKKGNPGKPALCKPPPVPPVPVPPIPGDLWIIPSDTTKSPHEQWRSLFILEVPGIPPNTLCTIYAKLNPFNMSMPQPIYNYNETLVWTTAPSAPGDYGDQFRAEDPWGHNWYCYLTVHVV